MRLVLAVAFQLWIVLFIVFFGAEVVHQEPALRMLSQLLYAVPLAAWAVLRLRGLDSLVDVAIGVALVLYLGVSLLGSDPVGGLETLGLALGLALLYRAARNVAGDEAWRRRAVVGVSTGLAVTLALNAWLLLDEKLTWIRAGGGVPELEGTRVFPWETVNVMPVLVLLTVPFLAWMPAGRLRSLLASVVAVAAVVVVPISQGRAGWAAMAIAAFAYVLLRPLWRPSLPRPAWLRASVVATAGVLLLAIGLVAAGRVLAGTAREPLWEQSLGMVMDSPVLGSGPGTYSWARFEFGPPEARFIAVRLTHNVLLQTLIDGGFVLLLGLGLVVGAWLREVARSWVSVDRAGRLAVAALVGVVAAYQLDDFSFLPAVTALVVVIAAFSLPPSVPPPPSPPARLRWAPLVFVAMLAVITLPAVASSDAARTAAGAGRAAAVAGDWPAAETEFARAASARSGHALYWLQLGFARSLLGNPEGAAVAYARAAALAPGDPRAHGALAELGEEPDRMEELRDAAALTTGDGQYAYRLGLALAEAGDADGATSAWGRAVTLRSDMFAVFPYADAGIDPAAVADAALEQLRLHPVYGVTAEELAWNIGLAQGALSEDAGLPWRAVHAAVGGDLERARALAADAVSERPYDARSYAAQAAVARYACDLDEEQDALELWNLTRNASRSDDGLSVEREFVYRQATLGAMQPPGAEDLPPRPMWPWGLVPHPDCEP